jgi:1-phosphofructokinase
VASPAPGRCGPDAGAIGPVETRGCATDISPVGDTPAVDGTPVVGDGCPAGPDGAPTHGDPAVQNAVSARFCKAECYAAGGARGRLSSEAVLSRLVTVTLNPAIDLTVTLAGLTPGAVHRAEAAETHAGGKGVNVAACVAAWGLPVAATGVLGAGNDAAFVRLFAQKGIVDCFVRAPGDTRTNIKIADTATGETTDVNMPGLAIGPDAFAAVTDRLDGLVGPGTVAVLAGSLPAGLDSGAWARLVARLDRAGARVVLDTSGAPLAAALSDEAGALPGVIKPNRAELEAWAGRPLAGEADLVATARRLTRRGVGLVVISLGAEGALFVSADAALKAALPPVRAVSTVGAGDAMVAGIATALEEGLDPAALARRAVAFAAAKLERIGSHLPPAAEVAALAERATVVAVPFAAVPFVETGDAAAPDRTTGRDG